MTDPIADYLTRVRNAYMAGKKIVEIPSSKMKLAITKILCEKGYILSYKVVEGQPANTIKIALKYHPQTKTAAIKKIERVSKPGLRKYTEDRARVQAGSQEIYKCGGDAESAQRSRNSHPFHFKGYHHGQGGKRAECRWRGIMFRILI